MNIHSNDSGTPIEDAQDKRSNILRAGLRLFDEQGFHGTSMSEIAEAAGVAAGTIYQYFDGKEDLVDQLYAEARDEAHRSVLNMGFDEDASVRERLRMTWEAVIRNYMECPRLYRFILQYESSAYLRRAQRAQPEDLRPPFQEIYQDGVEQELFPELPQSVYRSFFIGTVTNLVQEHLNGGPELEEALIDQSFEMLWAAYTKATIDSDPSDSGHHDE
jgi:AcrR family transcriptional regulator